jgi:energy-coupling factor transporter ATP-binding protein EcfA2
MSPQSRFSLNNLIFSFDKNGSPFFDNLNVSFKSNDLNFIQGKNGTGKSTLMRIMHGDTYKNEYVQGTLQIDDNTYDLRSPKIAEKVAMVTQNFNTMLIDSYSFKENLQCALMPRFPNLKVLPQPKPIPPFIEKYGINYEVPISSLSGGQRQILSILMILQQRPRILLLDEPTATLDEDNTKLIMDFLTELCIREKIIIILIVHNKEIIQNYCGQSFFELKKDSEEKRILTLVLKEKEN